MEICKLLWLIGVFYWFGLKRVRVNLKFGALDFSVQLRWAKWIGVNVQKFENPLGAKSKVVCACFDLVSLMSSVQKSAPDMFCHWHFIGWVLLDDVSLECAQEDLSFCHEDRAAVGILQLGSRLLGDYQRFGRALELERVEKEL
jgi:hypothetical protein